jgi:hypothetical protein
MRALVLTMFLLGGCALVPLSEAECKPASWRASGYAHGLSGAPAQDLRMAPECSRLYGVDVPQEEYLAGWRDGHDEWDRLMGSMDVR